MRNWLIVLRNNASLVEAVAAIVQATTAGLIAYLTWRLVKATDDYARHTREALDHGLRQFELTKTQFDREWLPQLHVSLGVHANARLTVTNLSKNSVHVTHLFLGTDQAPDEHSFDVDLPIPGLGRAEYDQITSDIQRTVERYVRNHVWAGVLRIRLGFTIAGVPRPSDWFNYQVRMENGLLTEARPSRPIVILDQQRAPQPQG